jgi:hypothetical protein
MGLYGSSLGDVSTAHNGVSHRGIPRSDSDEFAPEFWGADTGDCVSPTGRVRTDHLWIDLPPSRLEDAVCAFCASERSGDVTFYVRAPIKTSRPRPLKLKVRNEVSAEALIEQTIEPGPLKDAQDALLAINEERRSHHGAPVDKSQGEPATEHSWECCECGGLNPKGFGHQVLRWCLNCFHPRPSHRRSRETEGVDE